MPQRTIEPDDHRIEREGRAGDDQQDEQQSAPHPADKHLLHHRVKPENGSDMPAQQARLMNGKAHFNQRFPVAFEVLDMTALVAGQALQRTDPLRLQISLRRVGDARNPLTIGRKDFDQDEVFLQETG